MSNDISEFLPKEIRELEWYDNSTLATIDKCNRKGFWKNVYQLPNTPEINTPNGKTQPKGIAERMGIGAFVGTAFHAALDRYYAPLNSTKTYEQRKIIAFRALASKYAELILEPELAETKYSLPRCIDVLDMYFTRYEEEDKWFKVIDTEVVAVVVIRPKADEPDFTPFNWIARSDGTIERTRYQDRMVMEHKTATSPEQKLTELVMSRQTEGYCWAMSEFPSEKPIVGIMANVISIRAAECDPSKLFFRDYISKSKYQLAQWRFETIRKVLSWRAINAAASTTPHILQSMQYFTRNTEECTRYGRCSFYDLCLHGPQSVDLNNYTANIWNPLYAEKMDPP